MKTLINKNGITIKELKELVKDLPEVDESGENYEVWIMNINKPTLSSPAKTIMKLNGGDIVIVT